MLGCRRSLGRSLATSIMALLLLYTHPHTSSPDLATAQDNINAEPFQLSNAVSYMDYDMLVSFFGGDAYMNPGNFTRLVQEYLIPANVALVGLSVGWEQHANTSFSNIPFHQWVDDFLSIADLYGIKVVFHFTSWNLTTELPSWGNDVVIANPELSSNFNNAVQTGQPDSLVIDSPLLVDQLKEDLKQLYAYYGNHLSWIGFAFGHPGASHTYAPLDQTPSVQMVQWYSLHNFFDTIYFKRNIDATGYHVDGTMCKFWETYMENEPLVKLQSGNRQTSGSIDVFGGKGEGGRCIATRIEFNSDHEGFQMQWYGKRQGMPGDLVLELYEDDDDMPMNLGSPVETIFVPVESMGASNIWQPLVEFSSSVSKDKRYWIVMSSEGDNRNKYVVYRNEYRLDDETHVRYTTNGYDDDWEGFGNACIILQELNGVKMTVCPVHRPYNKVILPGTVVSQSFIATEQVEINTIWVYFVDRAMANDPRPLPMRLVRASDNVVIAEGELGIQYTRGTYWWSTVPLDRSVTLYEGQEYRLELGPGPADCILWQFLMDKIDPPEYGFQGQQSYLLFALADMNADLSLTSYSDSIPILVYKDPITLRDWMAVGFTSTTQAKLENFSIKITKTGEPSDLRIAIYDDDPRPSSWYGLSKPRYLIEEQIVAAPDVPSDGWLEVSGWKAMLDRGARYWVVLSQTSSSSGYYKVPSKNPNHILPFVYSTDGGGSWRWGFPYTNTPAEPLVRISTSSEVISNEPWEVLAFYDLKDNTSASQSFILNKGTTIRGVNLWFSQRFDSYDEVIVQIATDSSDAPSRMILGETTIRPGEGLFSGSSLVVADFAYPLKLRPGKYWVVIKAQRLFIPIMIWADPDNGFGGSTCKAKVTHDGGLTWAPPSDKEADLVFSIVGSPVEPRYTVEDLATDIMAYHTQAVWSEPLQGWNVFLNIKTSMIQKELITWFNSYTSRNWISLDPNPPEILEEADSKGLLYGILEVEDPSSMSIIGAVVEHPNVEVMPSIDFSMSNVNESETFFHSLLPITGRPLTLLGINDLQELQIVNFSRISYLWNLTKRMAYAGGYFGTERGSPNALLIGDRDSLELARYLKSMVNVTFMEPDVDFNFTKFGNFDRFRAIIWMANKGSMDEVTESARVRIKEFVKRGGAIIFMNTWAGWADEMVGFTHTEEEIPPGSINHVDYEHPIIRPYSDIPEFTCPWSGNAVLPIHTNATSVIADSNGQPVISVSSYGSGHGLLFGAPPSVLAGSEAGFATMLVNSIYFTISEKESMPVIWHRDFRSGGTPNLRYSIMGRQGGPILIWLANSGPTVSFDLSLSASFLHIDPKGWVSFDLIDWLPIMRGNGDNISIGLEAKGKSWTAVCIVNSTGDPHVIYSNAVVISERSYPNQVLYELAHLPSHEIWAVIDAPYSPDSIIIDNDSVIMIRPLNLANATMAECWSYEDDTQLILVKLLSKGTQTIRVLKTISQIPSTILQKVVILVILFFILAVEVVVTKRKRPVNAMGRNVLE